jgi:hypothetical protein
VPADGKCLQPPLFGFANKSIRLISIIKLSFSPTLVAAEHGAVGRVPLQKPTDNRPYQWRGIMKALIAALALVTLLASPTFAQTANSPTCGGYGWGPSSPCYGP